MTRLQIESDFEDEIKSYKRKDALSLTKFKKLIDYFHHSFTEKEEFEHSVSKTILEKIKRLEI